MDTVAVLGSQWVVGNTRCLAARIIEWMLAQFPKIVSILNTHRLHLTVLQTTLYKVISHLCMNHFMSCKISLVLLKCGELENIEL